MSRYGSVLPEPFKRNIQAVVGFTDTYGSTEVRNDPSFEAIQNASFLVFEPSAAAEILGSSPSVEFIFPIAIEGHEAPTYAPNVNKLFFSKLNGEESSQYVIDLSQPTLSLENVTSNPPTLVPAGGTYHEGKIYWCGSAAAGIGNFSPGIYAFDPVSNTTEPVLNNYFGYKFSTCDDIAVHPTTGDIWFTDNWYDHNIGGLEKIQNKTFQLPEMIWRFNSSRGSLHPVDTSLNSPNGIAFSPSGSKVYFTDTSADYVSLDTNETKWVQTNARLLYVADVLPKHNGIFNKRPIFQAFDRIPDGLKVASNGFIATATGHGVDILDEDGLLLVRVQTNFTVLNIAWAGSKFEDLWMVGVGGVGRVKWNLTGVALV
jgi:sugar lactone lactonase YvrE